MEEEIEQIMRIPEYLNAESFLAARFKELHTLSSLMKKSNRVTSIFQRLPKRMRRRAMSHTVKRVPRDLREAHKRQLVKNKALQKPKNKRKLHRKRPKQLLLEYNRRQKTKLWLETHIWHAKRFRMIPKWGYKLAYQSYEKTFKASYRAMKSHCLVQDISYYGCIEIAGSVADITEGLSHMTSTECGLTVGAKCWLNGNREGAVTLYHSHRYPYDVIGPVTFMWRPASTETCQTLWLWCHPAFYHEVLDEFISVFKLQPVICSDNVEMEAKQSDDKLSGSCAKQKQGKDVEKTIINLKSVPSSRVDRYSNKNTNVVVSSLKNTMNRFRLCGPLSNAVLNRALHPAELFDHILGSTPNDDGGWWSKFCQQRSPLSTFRLLDEYSSPSHFPPHVIMGSCVVDPRLFLKRKRQKALPSSDENEYCLSVSPSLSSSMIWDSGVRDEVSLTKFTTAKINRLRSELLVPGFDEQLLRTVNTVVPILFVQKPGSSSSSVKLGFGSGWDIIVPANWAMPVWLSLILCGAKPGGLREMMTLQFETQTVPELFPDSLAGIQHYDDIKEDCENAYFRKAPNKRVNFIKYGIQTPFHYPWQCLVEEWSSSSKPSSSPYHVFRNRAELRKVRTYLNAWMATRHPPSSSSCSSSSSSSKCDEAAATFSFPASLLVAVHLEPVSGGALSPFSHICVATEADLRRRAAEARMFEGPRESLHLDVHRKKRKLLKQAHQKLLKRLRRQRVKEKRLRRLAGVNGGISLPARITKRKSSPTTQHVEEYLRANRKLWIPDAAPAVGQLRAHCDRQICGFVTTSGFSYLHARMMGLGYLTGESLSVLLDLQRRFNCRQPVVLTRTPNSLCYRFCTFNVVV